MGNIYRGVVRKIRGVDTLRGEFPDIQDGVRGMLFVEAVLRSAAEKNRWVEI
jgi:hypothetical protein